MSMDPSHTHPTSPLPAAQPLPFLPKHIWTHIVRHCYSGCRGTSPCAASGGWAGAGACPTVDATQRALRTLLTLALVSKHVAEAAAEVPLDLQFDGHEEEDVTRWLPLLRRAPICTLRAAAGGEAVLRDAGVRARSAGSLVAAAAAVTCTDTLQWFPNLAWLELRVGAIDVLYPAVLDGVRAAHLGLVHYQRMALEELPPSLVATLRSVDVTPLPVARLSHFCLRLPPGIALRRLAVHGSFGAIASTKAAPRLNLDVASVCASCAHVLAEGRSLTFRLPRGAAAARRRSGAGGPGDWEVELAAALLEGWGATGWQRLELRLLCPFVFVWVELPLVGGHTGEASRVDLGPLATAVVNLSRGRVAALLSHERVSIFDVHCLVLERQGGEALVEQL